MPNSVTAEKAQYHAGILANRLRKRFRHLSRRFARQGISCFRLYDWDIKEVRAVVDWYSGHAVIGEYVRWQTGEDWLPRMAQAVAESLNIPLSHVHMKRRQTNPEEGPRYTKSGVKGKRLKVQERNLYYWIDLDSHLDTGLFSDHRDTRTMLGELTRGNDFLNLFAYTGTFTCSAAAGGAKSTVSVDRSETYIGWAKDNLVLNGLWADRHTLIQSDAGMFLDQAYRQKRRFDLAFVDPPSFFQDRLRKKAFDVNADHPQLLKDVLKLMRSGATVFFSTNHQRFEPQLSGLPVRHLTEITADTIPEDYRNRKIHRCWRMEAI